MPSENAVTKTARRVLPARTKRYVVRTGHRFAAWLDTSLPPVLPELPPDAPELWTVDMSAEDFVDAAYRTYLHREPDAGGREHMLTLLASGALDRRGVAQTLNGAAEGERIGNEANAAFHESRMVWTRSLPPARRILDLGGTALGDDRGALLVMGYPYDFDEIEIIELPPDDRHDLYKTAENKPLETGHGRVSYMYRSMADLDDLPDASYDMICSAQTFEHVTPEEGAHILREVHRLLKPGGVLALDTPNGAISSIQAREMGLEVINPDHKKEYTHKEMVELFTEAGFQIVRQYGIGFMPETARTGVFDMSELSASFPSIVDDIERSYTLAYLVTPA